MFWPAVLIATLGNTIGGVISFAMGSGAEKAYERWRVKHEAALQSHRDGRGADVAPGKPPAGHVGGRWHAHVHYWADRLGPMALLFSWLPGVGDPLCDVAGWLRLHFWPSGLNMAIGRSEEQTSELQSLKRN